MPTGVLLILILYANLSAESIAVFPNQSQSDVILRAVNDETLSPVQALAEIEAVAQQSGWTDTLYTQAGALHYRTGNYAAAAASWERVVEANAAVTRRLSEVYLDLEAWADASDALRHLLEFEPDDLWARYQLGMILAALNPFEAQSLLSDTLAIPTYARVSSRLLATLHDHADDPLVSMQVALALFELQEWAHAELAFEQAALVNDPYPDALAYLGLSRSRQGKAGEAWILAAIQMAPDNPYVWYANGIYLRDQRRFEESLDALANAIAFAPGDPFFMAELSMSYRVLGDMDAAEYWLRQAVERSGNAEEFQQMLLLFYAEEGYRLTDEGLRQLADASQSLPNDPDLRSSYGWALHTMGRTDDALTEISVALSLAPENARANYYRGRIAFDEGDLDLATEYLTRVAVSISPYAIEASAYLQQIDALAGVEIVPEITAEPDSESTLDPSGE